MVCLPVDMRLSKLRSRFLAWAIFLQLSEWLNQQALITRSYTAARQ